MAKKRVLKVFCSILAVILVLSSALSVSAAVAQEPTVSPCYTTIGTTSCAVTISGITAKCNATLASKTSTSLKVVMELQKKGSSSYSTVQTWSDSRTGTILSVSGSKAINLLSTYRLKVTFTAGSETTVVYDTP